MVNKYMNTLPNWLLIMILAFSLLSCDQRQGELMSTETRNDEQIAFDILMNFLESLHNGEYDEAARLYGGTYEIIIDQNPGIDANDHVALLGSACTVNGMQCLPVKSAGLDKKVSDLEFIFKVDFMNEDGSLFLLGPCCGGEETDPLPQSVFYFTVIKMDDKQFTVMDLPPYAP